MRHRPPVRPSAVEAYYTTLHYGWCKAFLACRVSRNLLSTTGAYGSGRTLADALQEAARKLRQELWASGVADACTTPVCAPVEVEYTLFTDILHDRTSLNPMRRGRGLAGPVAGTLGAVARTGHLTE